MEPIKIVILLSILTLGSLAICWLDYKKGWQLADWLNGRCSNPFKQTEWSKSLESAQVSDEMGIVIKQLTERVQVLEKVVTEPSYELNKN